MDTVFPSLSHSPHLATYLGSAPRQTTCFQIWSQDLLPGNPGLRQRPYGYLSQDHGHLTCPENRTWNYFRGQGSGHGKSLYLSSVVSSGWLISPEVPRAGPAPLQLQGGQGRAVQEECICVCMCVCVCMYTVHTPVSNTKQGSASPSLVVLRTVHSQT